MGQRPEREVVTWCSDASVLSRYGIETVNYGPSSGPRDAEGEKVHIKTLVDITKIYALIAAELHISPKTVKNHISNILMKLQIENRIQAAVYAVRSGIV